MSQRPRIGGNPCDILHCSRPAVTRKVLRRLAASPPDGPLAITRSRVGFPSRRSTLKRKRRARLPSGGASRAAGNRGAFVGLVLENCSNNPALGADPTPPSTPFDEQVPIQRLVRHFSHEAQQEPARVGPFSILGSSSFRTIRPGSSTQARSVRLWRLPSP